MTSSTRIYMYEVTTDQQKGRQKSFDCATVAERLRTISYTDRRGQAV